MSLINCKIIGDAISYDVYSRQLPGVKRGDLAFSMSRSELIAFFECPEKWLSREESVDTEATKMGKLVETLETSPDDFDSLFVVEPETYVNSKGKEAKWTYRSNSCKEWKEESEKNGLVVISPKLKLQAERAAEVMAKSYDPRKELYASSKKQVMVVGFWNDGDLEIPLRCLIDLVPDKNHEEWGIYLGDGKTARNGDPSKWDRVVDDSGYDVQAALSTDLYVAATGENRCAWVFPLSENQPPFHVVKPMPCLSTEFLQWGREKYQDALLLYAECLRTGRWPSYPAKTIYKNVQIIGPDNLWNYKKTGGVRTEYQPEPKRQ